MVKGAGPRAQYAEDLGDGAVIEGTCLIQLYTSKRMIAMYCGGVLSAGTGERGTRGKGTTPDGEGVRCPT